jgi:hypothetical protein
MNGTIANSDAVLEKLETAPNKFTAPSLSSCRPCKCRLYNAAVYPISNLYVAKRYVSNDT